MANQFHAFELTCVRHSITIITESVSFDMRSPRLLSKSQ